MQENRPPEEPFDEDGHPTQFEVSKSTCQKYIGKLMWLATKNRPDVSPTLGIVASQMVIRPTYVVTCLIHLWKYLKGTSELSMTSFSLDSAASHVFLVNHGKIHHELFCHLTSHAQGNHQPARADAWACCSPNTKARSVSCTTKAGLFPPFLYHLSLAHSPHLSDILVLRLT